MNKVQVRQYSQQVAGRNVRLCRVVQNTWDGIHIHPKADEVGPQYRATLTGCYRVISVAEGKAMGGVSSEYSVAKIELPYPNLQWAGAFEGGPAPTGRITIDPSPTGDNATAPDFTGWWDDGFKTWRFPPLVVNYGGSGYKEPPIAHVHLMQGKYNGLTDFDLTCRLFVGGIALDKADHGIKPDEQVFVRYVWFNEYAGDEDIPTQQFFRCGVIVTGVEGPVIKIDPQSGTPQYQPPYDPQDVIYIPGDEGYSFGMGTGDYFKAVGGLPPPASDLWLQLNYDANKPPMHFVVYRYEPEVVHFYQQLGGGPLPIGSYVMVFDDIINPDLGVKECAPVHWIARPPWA